MPSKLGPHCLTSTATARQMLDAGCRIIKMVDDFGLAAGLAGRTDITVIGRVYSPFTAESQRGEDPAAAAARFIDSQKDKYKLNPAIKVWEGHNEPVWGNLGDMAWYAQFEIARLKLLAAMGLRGVIGCFATGNPGDISLWQAFVPAVQAAKQMNGILGLHEYSSPWVWWMSGRFQMDPNADAGDEGWTTLRYRKVVRNYLKPAGCDDVPIAITEFGLDKVAPVPSGAPSGHWRNNAGWWANWNGSRDPIDYWRNGGRDAEIYYAEQLIWYDRELRKDANVLGATIFTVGSNNSAWDGFNIDGTRVAAHLVEYIRGQAGVADAGAPAAAPKSQTATQPANQTPATPPPAVVITGPAQGTATGVNLLANPNFDDGQHYHWHNTPEIVIPNQWDFWYQTDKQLRLERQDQAFDPPECVVWNIAGAPLEERSKFFLSGNYCLKAFKGWGAVWFRLFQTVHNLTPGARYRFTAPVFPDLYMDYKVEKGGKIWADDPLAGEVRLSAAAAGKVNDTGWLDGTHFKFGTYTFFTLDFVAAAADVELSVECRGRWGLLNNGWFMDSMKLEAIGAPAPSGGGTSGGAAPAAQAKTGNLLQNANFSGGTFQPNSAIRNMEAPNGWTFWCADDQTPKLAKQAESFRPPRAGVITPAAAAPDDQDGLTGGLAQAYRVVGNWRAVWFSLSQKVSGLTAGQTYTFTAQMMPDPVDKYLPPDNHKQFVADPDGGEVWLKSQSGSASDQTFKRVNADFQPGGYVTFSHDFTAGGTDATVTLEVRARYALTQNAWYVSNASLVASGAPAGGGAGGVQGQAGRRGITGALRLAQADKQHYAAQIENIKIVELITNTTSIPQKYGVIGVEILNRDTGEKTFHTSFSGDLSLGPNCQGPKDSCGGEWVDQLHIDKAGNYRLALAICYNAVQEALAGHGDWETLTPYLDIVVDVWKP